MAGQAEGLYQGRRGRLGNRQTYPAAHQFGYADRGTGQSFDHVSNSVPHSEPPPWAEAKARMACLINWGVRIFFWGFDL